MDSLLLNAFVKKLHIPRMFRDETILADIRERKLACLQWTTEGFGGRGASPAEAGMQAVQQLVRAAGEGPKGSFFCVAVD
jgi:hypothetical protein